MLPYINKLSSLKLLLVLVIFSATLFFPMGVNALSGEERDAINRNSVHFKNNPSCEVGTTADNTDGTLSVCCTAESGGTESVTLGGNTKGSNAEKLFVYLVSKGLTAKQTAGIIGNVMQESGGGTFNIDPNALNPSSGAYGIIQWYAGRKTALINYANSVGKPKNDLQMQMDFMWKELTGSYKTTVLDPIKASTEYTGDKGSLRIWLEKYEIPCPNDADPNCDKEYNLRKPFADKAYQAFSGLSPDYSSGSSGQCSQGSGNDGNAFVDSSGFAFPVVLPKNNIGNWHSWPCRTTAPYCHHDGTPAFDLAKKALDDSSAGVEIVAVTEGSIASINTNYKGTGCQSLQFKSKDGWYYWYGHIRTDAQTPKIGDTVKAGTHLGKIGERKCTGNNSAPHLHIDRGSPKGYTGGEDAHRDVGFISIMNDLYKKMP